MATINGTAGNDVLQGTGAADTISGLAGNDVLIGEAGNDTLNGGTGADTMVGGAGNDSYIVDDAGDVVTESTTASDGTVTDAGGTDVVSTSVSYALGAFIENLNASGTGNITLTGNAGVNVINGNSGNNVLDGGLDAAGGAPDLLRGGAGNDTYIVRDGAVSIYEAADDAVSGTAGGTDQVIVVASAVRNAYVLTSTTGPADETSIAQVESIIASDASSTLRLDLTGNTFTQTIVGNAGVNTLADGGGSDTLIGLGGNDIYTVSSGLVTVVEGVDGGTDIINITGLGNTTNSNTASATLGDTAGGRDYNFSNAAVEQISAAAAGTGFLNITGSSINQQISGNAGSNVLNGNGGADTLTGLGGNDTYVVDGVEDVVIEAANGGTDRVIAGGNYVLARNDAAGAAVSSNVEQLTAAGTQLNTRTGQGDGTFNLNALSTNTTLNNFLVGDSLQSQLIVGSAGNNILDGYRSNGNPDDTAAITGAADTLVGLGGSDTYRVYAQSDVVVEDTNGGFDWIYTSANYSLLTNDTNARAATFVDEDGVTRSFGGAAGAAGGGNDGGTYLGVTGATQIEILSAANQGSDAVAINLEGNTFGQIIVGNFAANVISDGGNITSVLAAGSTAAQLAAAAGNSAGSQDQLAGLRGNDTYNVTSQSTTVNEDVGNGTDTVNVFYQRSGGTFGLIAAAEVEFLNASNAGVGINLFGNGFNQVITGNTGADALNGGGGQDTLVGGAGSDVYVIDSTNSQNVTIIELASDDATGPFTAANPQTLDRVNASVSFDLAATNVSYVPSAGGTATTAGGIIDIEQIVGIGSGDISLTGNGGRQLIVGTTGNNLLNGDNDTLTGTVMTGTAAGDTMQGLAGNDSYRVYSQNDVALERDGEGTDIVFAGTGVAGSTTGNSYVLYAGQSIEGLTAANQSSTVGMLLSGNELAQSAGIIGTNGNDTIWGLGGNDVLTGRGGSDIFGFAEIGAGNADTITDFNPGDFIGLSTVAFGSVGAGLASDEFVVGTQALDGNDYIIYNQSTGQIFYDADGNGTGSTAILFAQVTPNTALGFNDFVVLDNTVAAQAVPVPPTFTTATYG